MIGCAVTTLVCGCVRSINTSSCSFEMNALHICSDHLLMPEVQEAKVKDVWSVIMTHVVCTLEEGEVR